MFYMHMIMLYDSEVWELTKSDCKGIQDADIKLLREVTIYTLKCDNRYDGIRKEPECTFSKQIKNPRISHQTERLFKVDSQMIYVRQEQVQSMPT